MNGLPRLLATRPALEQVLLSVVPATIFGVVTGIVVDLSSGFYYALLVLAVLGGVAAGMEHATTGEGAQRGLVGGMMFGAGVLAGHHLLGRRAMVKLPHPEAVEVLVAALFSVPLGMLGAWLRGRIERRTANLPPETTIA